MTKPRRGLVGAARFELTTSWSQTRRDTGLRYAPITKSPFQCRAEFTPSFLGATPRVPKGSAKIILGIVCTRKPCEVIRPGVEPGTVSLEG
jgi:hypothetical protein